MIGVQTNNRCNYYNPNVAKFLKTLLGSKPGQKIRIATQFLTRKVWLLTSLYICLLNNELIYLYMMAYTLVHTAPLDLSHERGRVPRPNVWRRPPHVRGVVGPCKLKGKPPCTNSKIHYHNYLNKDMKILF